MNTNQYETFKQFYQVKQLENNDRIESFDCGDDDFDNKNIYNRFSRRFNNRKRLKSYPAVKIGRLGVSTTSKGKNVGSFIIKFIKTYFIYNNKSGCRFLTVDAYSEAVLFYYKNGFVPLNNADLYDRTRLLYYDLSDVSE